jgi:oxygen-independent coproporphyrinogen-3 oxidase
MPSLTKARLPRPRDVSHEFGIYVHVPFCSHRCWYCDFNAYAGLDDLAPAYMDALAADVRGALSAPRDADLDQRPVVTSIFIGGGTPSLVGAGAIARVLDAIRDTWPVAPGAEITIECNPDSVEAGKLDTYLDAGIDRISIGVQSLDATSLARLGRTHAPQAAVDALTLARSRGFAEVSGDLIFGIPGEDDGGWRESLDGVLATGVTHLSCYALIYEDGTPLDSWRKLGKVVPVPDDDVAGRWEIADAILERAGLHRYEISNWARPGSGSRHNGLYWSCGEYLGVGAGAHSHLSTHDGATRSWTLKSPERYIRAMSGGGEPVAGREVIDDRLRATEVMILGLRRSGGVSGAEFSALVGRSLEDVFAAEVAAALSRGSLAHRGDHYVLTRPFLANEATVLFA